MSVSDGQLVNAAVSNAAWISRLIDSNTVGKLDLENVSTTDLIDLQRVINEALSSLGIANQAATDASANVYSSNNVVTDGDNRKVAIGKLDAESGTVISDFSIANNQAAPANVTGLVFDKVSVKAARIFFDISRRTDTQNVIEVGEMFCVFDAEADDWRVSLDSKFDDGGLTFTITSVGQVQYTSTDLTGTSYSGTLKMKDVTKIAI